MKITIRHKGTEFSYEDTTKRSIGDIHETPRIVESIKEIFEEIKKLDNEHKEEIISKSI